MRFLIVQPCWDHSEILASLLYFIKKNGHQVKIIYDWSHPEGNYLDYYCNLFGFDDNVKYNYKSPKFHIKAFTNAHKIIFVDEIHLRKFMSKTVYKNLINKCYTFNHISKNIPYNIKIFSLGTIPFNYCINTSKYLVNSFYNPKIEIKTKLENKKKYLIVGNPKYREVSFLEKLEDNLDIEINFVVRKPLEITKPFIKVHLDLSTDKLLELIKETDFIITLFKKDCVYYKDRISGIVPFAISFGKPLIMDKKYQQLTEYKSDDELIYDNNFTNFEMIIKNSIKMKSDKYKNIVEKIIDYRDKQIMEQYLNWHLIFV